MLADHVRGCPECAAELGGSTRLLELLRTLPEPVASPDLDTRILAAVFADRQRREERRSWLSNLPRQVFRGAMRTTGTLVVTVVTVALVGGAFVFAASQFIAPPPHDTARGTLPPVATPTAAPTETTRTAEPTAGPVSGSQTEPAVTVVPTTRPTAPATPLVTDEPTPEPTPSASPAPTPSPVATEPPTPSPSPSTEPSVTPSPVITPEPTASPAPTATPSPSATASPSESPSPTPDVSATRSRGERLRPRVHRSSRQRRPRRWRPDHRPSQGRAGRALRCGTSTRHQEWEDEIAAGRPQGGGSAGSRGN